MLEEIKALLADVLQIGDKVANYDEKTALLGSIPEFDSMAVVALLTAIEDQYGIVINDDEVDAEVFETIGSLVTFIEKKLA